MGDHLTKAAFVACGLFAGRLYCQGQGDGTAIVPAPPPAYVTPTHGETFHYYVRHTFSVESLVRSAAGAGISQLTHTPSEWGQGTVGYARRYGNSYAEHIIRQTVIYGAATALGEDNRYFRSERKGFGPRVMYGIESTFLTRRPGGKRRFAYSRVIGTLATAFISREWQPHSTNGAQNAWSFFASSTGTEVGFNVAREFFPNVLRH